MLSGDSNENGQKKSVDLISKKHLCTCSTLFSYISLPLFYTTTTWNFQKLPSYKFYRGNVVRVPVHFRCHCRSFSARWPPVFFSFSPPLQNFHVFLPTKLVALVLAMIDFIVRHITDFLLSLWVIYAVGFFEHAHKETRPQLWCIRWMFQMSETICLLLHKHPFF